MKILIQRFCLISADVSALFLSLLVAKLMLFRIKPDLNYLVTFHSFGFSKLIGLVIIIVFWYQEQYIKRRPIWEELRLLYGTLLIFSVVHLSLSYVVSHHVVKTLNVLFWINLVVFIPICRHLIKKIMTKFNIWQRDIYIVGTGENAHLAYNLLLKDNKNLGYVIKGFVSLNNNNNEDIDIKYDIKYDENNKNHIIKYINGIPNLSYTNLINDKNVNLNTEIIVALSTHELVDSINKINILQSKYAFVTIVPDINGMPLYGAELNHFFGSDQLFLRLQNNLGRRLNRCIKRIADIILSGLGIIILSPFFIFIGILIKCTAGGKVFFQHKRVGYEGKLFNCLKFRSMYPNSQEILEKLLATNEKVRQEWETDFKLKDDPRITKVGKILRKTSIDELPQLFNVLIGEMSLVGPRPIVTDEIERYEDNFYYYKLVKPGITGLWQISGRNDIDYKNRVNLDVWYVKNWSLLYDFVILFKTIIIVFKGKGAY